MNPTSDSQQQQQQQEQLKNESTTSTVGALFPENKDGKIQIRVVNSSGGEIAFRINPKTNVSKLINVYSKKMDISESSFRMIFDGKRLNPSQSFESVGIMDGDCIDIMPQQTGGSKRNI